jgi:hypothetical protein
MSLVYTTLEESKHLMELGLGPNTADMKYRQCVETTGMGPYALVNSYVLNIRPYSENSDDGNCIPCWSMQAMLDILSTIPQFKTAIRTVGNSITWTFMCYSVSEYNFYGKNDKECLYQAVEFVLENKFL